MAVDHRLDLLGMDLQPADVDDSVAAANEPPAAVLELDDIARVDESLGIR
jgi:hypothetical protein